MADTRPQPIPGVTMDSGELDFWYSMPADVQAKILQAPDRTKFPSFIKAFESMGIHTWADVKANQNSMIGPFQFWGIPGLQQGAQAVNGVADTATTVGDFLGRLSDPHMWTRILMVGIGAALVVTALGMLARPAVSPVASVVGKAVK